MESSIHPKAQVKEYIINTLSELIDEIKLLKIEVVNTTAQGAPHEQINKRFDEIVKKMRELSKSV